MIDLDRGAEAMSEWSTARARVTGKERPEADRASVDPDGAGDRCEVAKAPAVNARRTQAETSGMNQVCVAVPLDAA